jgi:hypothetical protein
VQSAALLHEQVAASAESISWAGVFTTFAAGRWQDAAFTFAPVTLEAWLQSQASARAGANAHADKARKAAAMTGERRMNRPLRRLRNREQLCTSFHGLLPVAGLA